MSHPNWVLYNFIKSSTLSHQNTFSNDACSYQSSHSSRSRSYCRNNLARYELGPEAVRRLYAVHGGSQVGGSRDEVYVTVGVIVLLKIGWSDLQAFCRNTNIIATL